MEDGKGVASESEAVARPLIIPVGELEVGGSSLTIALGFSVFVALCSSFSYGCAIAYSSPAKSGIQTDLGLTTAQYALFGSIKTAGSLASALISGKTADFIGRKRTMWLSQVFSTLGWLAIIMAENAWWLYMGRLGIGFGVGFVSFVVPVYVAEITPKNLRGALTAGHQMTISFGISMTFIIGTMISWRILAAIGCVAGFMQITGLFYIPESPRWLAKAGRENEIEAVLQLLRGKAVDVSAEAEEIQEYTKACDKLGNPSKAKILDLFQRKYAQALIVGVGLMVIQQFSGASAVISYASDVFEAAGFSTTVGSYGIAIIQIPALLTGVFLMDIWGRRPLTMLSVSGMCFSCCVVGSSFLLQDLSLLKEITPVLVFIGVLLFAVFYSFGLGAIPYILMSEIFPINVKGLAGPLMITVNSICSLIATYTFLFAMDWSSAGLFFIFSAVSGGGILFVAKLLPETKCRTLEEIQESMVHFK